MRRDQLSRREEAWARGVCAALAVIAQFDHEACWREVVAANGGHDYLRGISQRGGNLRIDGFTHYAKPTGIDA